MSDEQKKPVYNTQTPALSPYRLLLALFCLRERMVAAFENKRSFFQQKMSVFLRHGVEVDSSGTELHPGAVASR